jgi:predicted HTH domain antitoxin
MTLVLPDDPVTNSFTAKDLLLELACALYARRRVSLSQGARIAGMERLDFQAELCDREIPVHYSEADLRYDLDVLQKARVA